MTRETKYDLEIVDDLTLDKPDDSHKIDERVAEVERTLAKYALYGGTYKADLSAIMPPIPTVTMRSFELPSFETSHELRYKLTALTADREREISGYRSIHIAMLEDDLVKRGLPPERLKAAVSMYNQHSCLRSSPEKFVDYIFIRSSPKTAVMRWFE